MEFQFGLSKKSRHLNKQIIFIGFNNNGVFMNNGKVYSTEFKEEEIKLVLEDVLHSY